MSLIHAAFSWREGANKTTVKEAASGGSTTILKSRCPNMWPEPLASVHKKQTITCECKRHDQWLSHLAFYLGTHTHLSPASHFSNVLLEYVKKAPLPNKLVKKLRAEGTSTPSFPVCVYFHFYHM